MPLRDKSLSIPTVPPSVTDPGLRKQLESMRNALILLTGQLGNLQKSAVLFEDLDSLGLIELNSTTAGNGVATATPPETTDTADLTPPPTPTGLLVTPSINNMLIEFSGFTIPDDDVAFTEIYRNAVNDRSTATLAGVTYGYMYIDSTINDANTYYYWVRNVSSNGVYGNFNALSGTAGTLAETPVAVIDQLVKELSAQQTSGGAEILTMRNDLFAIQNSSGTGTEYPFIIGVVDGVTKIALAGTTFIPDAVITTAKIADAAITTAKIAEAAVQTAHIGTAQVIAAKIIDGEIKTANIAEAAVTTVKIQDQAVTFPVFYRNPARAEAYGAAQHIINYSLFWDFTRRPHIGWYINKGSPMPDGVNIYPITTALGDGRYAGGWCEVFNVPYSVTYTGGNITIDYRGGIPPLFDLQIGYPYSYQLGLVNQISIELQVLQDSTVVYSTVFTPLQYSKPIAHGINANGTGGTWTFMRPRDMTDVPLYIRYYSGSYYFNRSYSMFPEVLRVNDAIIASTISLRYRFVYPVSVPSSQTWLASAVWAESNIRAAWLLRYVHIYQGKK